jgi:hypothetical protein
MPGSGWDNQPIPETGASEGAKFSRETLSCSRTREIVAFSAFNLEWLLPGSDWLLRNQGVVLS